MIPSYRMPSGGPALRRTLASVLAATIAAVLGSALVAAASPVITKQAAVGDTVWVRVHDDSACSYTGIAAFGGRAVTSPGWAVWCFDGGATDSCSNTARYGGGLPGCWKHYDAHTALNAAATKWHPATYDVYDPSNEDTSMWCGEMGDGTWDSPPGYGTNYDESFVVNLGTSAQFAAATGMTISGVHLYSVELSYDKCFIDIGAAPTVPNIWVQVKQWTGISNPDSVTCRGLGQAYWGTTQGSGIGNGTSPYLCAQYTPFSVVVTAAQVAAVAQDAGDSLYVRWRFTSDATWDDQNGAGGAASDTRGAWRLDHLYVKGQKSPLNSYFPPAGAATRDPSLAAGNVDWESPTEDGRSRISETIGPAEAAGGYWNVTSWVHGAPQVVDLWHLTNTPVFTTVAPVCQTSNRWVWAANRTPGGMDGTIDVNAFHFRLASPVFDVSSTSPLIAGTLLTGSRVTGVAAVFDKYVCVRQVSVDAADVVVRRYDSGAAPGWRDWARDGMVETGGCVMWQLGASENASGHLSAASDSIQFGFDFFDRCDYSATQAQGCMPGVLVTQPHRKNTFLVDNVGVALFDATTSQWTAKSEDLFQDTFDQAANFHSANMENSELPGPLDREDSLAVVVSDVDGIEPGSIVLHYRVSTDCGTTWTHESGRPQGSKAKPAIEWFTKGMVFGEAFFAAGQAPAGREADGTYRSSLAVNATDFPGGLLAGGLLRTGTVVEYYLTANDRSVPAVPDTFPNRNDLRHTFLHPLYGAERQDSWPFEVTVLPCKTTADYAAQGGKRVLLVNDCVLRDAYDPEGGLPASATSVTSFPRFSQLYEEALRDLNVQFDRYDNNAAEVGREYLAGSGARRPNYSEPTDRDGYGGIQDGANVNRYDTVVWFTGDQHAYTVTDTSQLELTNYHLDSTHGRTWLSGTNLCEDYYLSDPSFAPAGGAFWTTTAGIVGVSGGCAGLPQLTDPVFYIEGMPAGDTLYTAFTLIGGWADCPRGARPDLVSANPANPTSTAILRFDNAAHNLNATAGVLVIAGGSPKRKTITTLFDLGIITTRAARACLTRSILKEFDVTMPAGSKFTESVCDNSTTDVGAGGPAHRFGLEQNSPNPFNPATRICFAIPKDGTRVRITIFDVSGREVARLVDRIENAGDHEVAWLGKNARGEEVSSGIYFYRLEAGAQSATRKMVLLK